MAQPVKDWDKGYGGEGYEDCNAAIQTTDLGYLLGGITDSDPSGDITEPSRDVQSLPWWFPNQIGDYWAIRTDEVGDTIWTARFGGNMEDRMWAVVETNDGGSLLGGVSYSDSTGDRTHHSRGYGDYWIVKTDAMGEKEWDRAYGGDSTDILNVLIQTQDGGYMLGGWSISSGWTETDSTGEKSDTLQGSYDWWIVKINAVGDVEWEKSYGGNDTEQLADIVQKEDGTYLIAGGTDSDISGDVDSISRGERDYWLLHIDSVGNELREYRYGGAGFDDLNRVIVTSDSGYVLAGSSYTLVPSGDKTEPGFGILDWWILKIDTAGVIQWQHTFGGSDIENIYSLTQNTVDHFMLGGFSRSVDGTLADNPTKGDNDFWVMYLDPDGNRLWDERYGGNASESMEQIFQTDDGGYLLAGHSRTDVDQDKTDPTNGNNDFWIVKTLCNINVELNDTIVCPGDSVIISAYDPNCIGCTYRWADNLTINDSIRIITTQSDVTYSVTLTDAVGCQRADEINITVYTPPSVDLGADVLICSGETHTFDAANSGLDFLWNTEETSQTIEAIYPGTYVVSVTDAIGCTTPDSIELNVSDLYAYIMTTNTSCDGDNGTATVIASGGSGNYNYTWTAGGSGASIIGLQRGEYEVLVDDGTCTLTVKGIVGFDEPPVVEWENNYGGSLNEHINDLKQTPDGGYIVVGSSESSDADVSGNLGGKDLWVKKLNAAGGIQWQRNYGGSMDDVGNAIEIDAAGGYIISGYTESSDGAINNLHGGRDVWVVRIDATGTLLWEETYGGTLNEESRSIKQTWEGGYILGNFSNSNDGDITDAIGGQDAWILKISSAGVIEWEKCYGGISDEVVAEIDQTVDGGYIFGAYSQSNVPSNYGGWDFYILKLDPRGQAVWRNNFGGSGDDVLHGMTKTNDGGFLFTGTSDSNDNDVINLNGGQEAWLIKVSGSGALQWQKTFGGAATDQGLSIDLNGDGHYLLSGISNSGNGDINGNYGDDDFIVVKINEANGDVIWSRNYGSTQKDEAYISFQTQDGGFLVAGTSIGADTDVSGNNGGEDDWIVKLNAPPLPLVSLPGDMISCAFDSVTFSPIINSCVACTWSWNDANTDSTRIEMPSVSTNYEIVISDEYGCTASDETMVTVNPLPVVDLGVNTVLCEGTAMTLDAGTDGTNYTWSTNEGTQTISVDTAATYAVTVMDANSCSAQDSILIDVNPIPIVDLGVDTSLCDGITFTLDAGNPGASYQWSTGGASTQTISVSTGDIYSVTVTDIFNCTAEDAVTVNFDALPQLVNIDLLDPGPFCPGAVFNINIQNSENGVLYELFDGNNISGGSITGNGGAISIATGEVFTTTTFNIVASFAGLCADTLTASTIANIGDDEAPLISCRSDTVIIIEDGNCDPLLSIGAPVSSADNCGVESVIYTLTGDTNVSSPSTGINDASGETFNVGLTTVMYTAIDSFGNIAFCSFDVEVIDQTEPLVSTPASDEVVECDGAGNTNAFNNWLSNNGGANAFDACSELTWSTMPASPSLSDGCGETGTVVVTFVAADSSGNAVTSTASFTIVDTQPPTFSVPADISIGANDDPTDLAITGDVTDESDGCDGGVDDQGPRVATYTDEISVDDCADIITRTWTLTDECGNSFEQVQIITQEFTPPSGSISGAIEICPGEPVDITFNLSGSSNNFNIIYTDEDQNYILNNISDGHVIQVIPTETTSYSILSVVDVSRLDCEGTIGNAVEIVVNQPPEGINIVETCDLLNTSYIVTFEITGGDAGSYSVTGDGGVLSGSEFTSLLIPKDSAYVFYVDDGNGCGPIEISGSFDCQCVTEAGSFQEPGLFVCGDETLTATLLGSNLDGNDLIEFIVHDGDANTIGNTIFYTSNTPEFSFQPGMMQYGVTYFVTVIAGTDDGNGNVAAVDLCYSESLGVPIIFNEPPIAVITAVTDTELDCIETSLHLIGSDSQTQGGISFEWSVDGTGNIVTGTTTDLVEVNEEGTYVLTITDLATMCTASTSILVTIDEDVPVAVIAEPAPLTCNDLTIQLNGNGSSTGPDFIYQWSGGAIESGGQTLTPVVSTSDTYTLMVTDTTNGCSDNEQIFVATDYTAPVVNAGPSQQLDCIQTEVTLNGSYTGSTNNITVHWTANPGNIISGEDTWNAVVDAGGTYTLTVINLDNGCSGEADVLVSVDPSTPQGAEMESLDPECYGDENGIISVLGVEGGTGPFTYSIDGENFYSNDQFNNLGPGEYNLIIQDAIGCEWDTLIPLQSPSPLIVELGDNIVIDLGDSVRLDAVVNQAIDTFTWNFPEISTMSPFVMPTEQTSYTIQVTNASGCEAEDYVTIVVRKDRNVYIPTAFSPNDDGFNDYFSIYSDQSVVNINEFRIFDRWGESLFFTENIQTNAESLGWNGTFKGRDMQPGVYIYFAEIEFFDGRIEIFKGDVTLVR